MQILELGTIITDKVTSLKGMLTILAVDMDKNIMYLFQPAGLDKKTQEPLDAFWVTELRIVGSKKISVELPLEVLNTQVEDKATGYNGTAIQIFYYLNGCVHFEVKPKGVIKESGASIKAREFDIRRLKGKMIKELTKKEMVESKKDKPSPEFRPSLSQR